MDSIERPGITREVQDGYIDVTYETRFQMYDEATHTSRPILKEKRIRTETKVPKLGVMLVGLGGNNGSTFTAGILANSKQLTWQTRNGEQSANFYGSFTQCATTHVGFKYDKKTGKLADVFKPVKDLLPMVAPVDFNVTGWDIRSGNLYEACKRSHVLEPTLIEQLKDDLSKINPLPAALNPDYIATNQAELADNVVTGTNKELIEHLRKDIQEFKKQNDKVIILWTANTEMFLLPEIEDLEDLERRIENNMPLPASVLYCMAAIYEGVTYLNGSPQNTFHPAIVKLAEKHGALLGGSDFKSGQTRFKTVMSDFIMGAGLRLASVVSYNHLGNNDGKNLSEDKTFRSK